MGLQSVEVGRVRRCVPGPRAPLLERPISRRHLCRIFEGFVRRKELLTLGMVSAHNAAGVLELAVGQGPSTLPRLFGSVAEREFLYVVPPFNAVRVDGLAPHADEYRPRKLLGHPVVSVHQIERVGKEPQPFLRGGPIGCALIDVEGIGVQEKTKREELFAVRHLAHRQREQVGCGVPVPLGVPHEPEQRGAPPVPAAASTDQVFRALPVAHLSHVEHALAQNPGVAGDLVVDFTELTKDPDPCHAEFHRLLGHAPFAFVLAAFKA